METITLYLEDPDYCQTDIPLPAFPVPLREQKRFLKGDKLLVKMPKINCEVIAKIDSIEIKKVSWVFKGKEIPKDFHGEKECILIFPWVERIQ